MTVFIVDIAWFFIELIFIVFIIPVVLWLSFFSSDISSDLYPLNFTLMQSRIKVINLDFRLESIAFNSATRSFSPLIANKNSFMNNSFFFHLWFFI